MSPRQGLSTPLLFLIGYRGTGKTTVSCVLAARLGWDWIDADEVLERHHGLSIRQIFAQNGETVFRDWEAGLLSVLCQKRRHVIATGGGVILRPENRERLRMAGRVAWLTATPATIWQRLQEDPATADRRPALTGGGLAEIHEVLGRREVLYQSCADLVVATEGRSPEEVADAILAQWSPGTFDA